MSVYLLGVAHIPCNGTVFLSDFEEWLTRFQWICFSFLKHMYFLTCDNLLNFVNLYIYITLCLSQQYLASYQFYAKWYIGNLKFIIVSEFESIKEIQYCFCIKILI